MPTWLALVGAYLLLCCLFLWQAWRRETPTIFTDELELTQLSRSIAETGEPAVPYREKADLVVRFVTCVAGARAHCLKCSASLYFA